MFVCLSVYMSICLSVCLCDSAAGVDIQSEKAYQLACQGLLRPAAYNQPAFSGPVLYDIRCIQFRPPDFTLGLSVNVSVFWKKFKQES